MRISATMAGLLCLLTALAFVAEVKSEEARWNVNPIPLPAALSEHAAVLYNNRIYLTGGSSDDGNRRNLVYFAGITTDGTIGTWTETTPLPEPREDHRAVVWNNFIYIVGGSTAGSVMRNTVWRAQVQQDGSLGSWQTMTPLPEPLTTHAAVVWGERIYVIGGVGFDNTVFYVGIEPDGSLGTWKATTPLPDGRRSAAAVAYASCIYVIGGQFQSGEYAPTVYYARTNSDGSVGTWTTASEMPGSREQAEAVVYKDKLYVIGGSQRGWEGQVYATVFSNELKSDKSLGDWQTEASLPEQTTMTAAVASEDMIYVLGGTTTCGADGLKSTVYYTGTGQIDNEQEADTDLQRIIIAVSATASIIAIFLVATAIAKKGKQTRREDRLN